MGTQFGEGTGHQLQGTAWPAHGYHSLFGVPCQSGGRKRQTKEGRACRGGQSSDEASGAFLAGVLKGTVVVPFTRVLPTPGPVRTEPGAP